MVQFLENKKTLSVNQIDDKSFLIKSANEFISRGLIPIPLNFYAFEFKEEKGVWKKQFFPPRGYNDYNFDNCLKEGFDKNNGLGIRTGEEGDVFLLDIDNIDDFKILLGSINKSMEDMYDFGTPCETTPSGGLHFYFMWEDRLKVIQNKTKEFVVEGRSLDIDTKGDNQFAIISPTKISGIDPDTNELLTFEYKWLDDFCSLENNYPEAMPDWLFDLLNGSLKSKPVTKRTSLKNVRTSFEKNLLDEKLIKKILLKFPNLQHSDLGPPVSKSKEIVFLPILNINAMDCPLKGSPHSSNHLFFSISGLGKKQQPIVSLKCHKCSSLDQIVDLKNFSELGDKFFKENGEDLSVFDQDDLNVRFGKIINDPAKINCFLDLFESLCCFESEYPDVFDIPRILFLNSNWFHFDKKSKRWEKKSMDGFTKFRIVEDFIHQKLDLLMDKTDHKGIKTNIAKIKNMLGSFSLKRPFLKNLSASLSRNVEFDMNPSFFATENGVWDFGKSIFRVSKPNDLISLNVPWSWSESTLEEIDKVEKFITDILPDQQIRDYFLHWVSTLLVGANKDQLVHFFVGQGSNGKSLLVHLIQKVLGLYSTSHDSCILLPQNRAGSDHNTAIYSLKNKRSLFVSEYPQNRKLDENLIKKISSGTDLIKVRKIYKDFDEKGFLSNCKIGVFANHLPDMTDADDALWRRFVFLKFETKFVINPTKPNEKRIDNTIDLDEMVVPFFNLIMKKYFDYNQICEGKLEKIRPKKISDLIEKFRIESCKVLSFFHDENKNHELEKRDANELFGLFYEYQVDQFRGKTSKHKLKKLFKTKVQDYNYVQRYQIFNFEKL